ncbi:unnamed protein product [Caretta caretta]
MSPVAAAAAHGVGSRCPSQAVGPACARLRRGAARGTLAPGVQRRGGRSCRAGRRDQEVLLKTLSTYFQPSFSLLHCHLFFPVCHVNLLFLKAPRHPIPTDLRGFSCLPLKHMALGMLRPY